VLVVGGIIIHEEDAWHLQQRLDSFLFNKLRPLGHDHSEFEIHASELRRGTKQWSRVGQSDRDRILAGAYGAPPTASPTRKTSPPAASSWHDQPNRRQQTQNPRVRGGSI
jgi:hypothetical protein